jgi:Arc/MetJ-type ribon-helix-helix transcriptional regulator
LLLNNKKSSYLFKGNSMKSIKTITISLPIEMGREIQKVANEEHRTVSELIRESFRRYKAQRVLKSIAKKGKSLTKKKGLKPEDFGGPFEE